MSGLFPRFAIRENITTGLGISRFIITAGVRAYRATAILGFDRDDVRFGFPRMRAISSIAEGRTAATGCPA